MRNPFLSVCIPNFNHAGYLRQAIDSLLTQSNAPDEIIVVDDASTDSSVQITQEIAARHSCVKLLCNEVNRGCNYSTNRGISAASGKYLFLLAADDYVLPGCFEKMLKLQESNPDAGVCLTPPLFVDAEGKPLTPEQVPIHYSHAKHGKIRSPCYLAPAAVLDLVRKQPWFVLGGPGLLFRRDVVLEAGGYLPDLGSLSDWFLLNFAALKYGLTYMPESLVAFRVIPGSYGNSQARNPDAALAERQRAMAVLREPRFSKIFSSRFLRDKEREFTYQVFRGTFVFWHRDFINKLNSIIQAETLTDRVCLRALKFISKIEQYLLKAYCKRNYRNAFPLK